MTTVALGHCVPGGAAELRLVAHACKQALRLNEQLHARLAAKPPVATPLSHGNLPWLIDLWKRSPEYDRLSVATKQNGYEYACRVLLELSARNGHPQVENLSRKAVWAFRDSLYNLSIRKPHCRAKVPQL